MEAIKIENLSVYFSNVCALDDINLTIKEKDYLGIIGPNGGGKSTLLKTVLGLIQPTSGKITVFGKPLTQVKGLMSYVPQFSKFNKQFPINVLDVILMGRLNSVNYFFQSYTQHDKELALKIMEKLSINNLRKRQIGQLSGGQLQKVLIARALMVEPKILLLDEPTASLDSKAKTEIYAILKDINKDVTIILISHDMGVISANVKSLACLNTKLYYHGEPELNEIAIGSTYGCPVELIAHGIPHRVLPKHEEELKC